MVPEAEEVSLPVVREVPGVFLLHLQEEAEVYTAEVQGLRAAEDRWERQDRAFILEAEREHPDHIGQLPSSSPHLVHIHGQSIVRRVPVCRRETAEV